jgi:nucleoside-diphosphate-sugar epimerase
MQILIRSVTGFIGFNFAKFLLDKNFFIYGVDKISDYYSVSLKKID